MFLSQMISFRAFQRNPASEYKGLYGMKHDHPLCLHLHLFTDGPLNTEHLEMPP